MTGDAAVARAQYASLLDDLADEQAALDGLVSAETLDQSTISEGWTIADTVGHLLAGDRSALLAVADPKAFALRRSTRLGHEGAASYEAAAGSELLDAWRRTRLALQAALAQLEPGARIAWYGPSMSARSFATARLMECWAHGEDVALALGRELPPTERLRHVCHLGVLTRDFSFTVRGAEPPPAAVLVDLEGPGGVRWTWGPQDAAEVVRGPARHFCLVVTQRRHLEDTALAVRGTGAAAWMRQAQAFAGAPTATAASRHGLHT